MYESKEAAYFQNPRSYLLPFVPQEPKTILDVGCGEGQFGASLKQRNNAEVWGVEYVSDFASAAKTRLDQAFSGPIEDHYDTLPDSYFDLVTFTEVLEHLFEPEVVLRRIAAKVKPGGHLFVSVPNLRYYTVLIEIIFNKDFRYQKEGVLDYTHIRWFTKKSLSRMIENAGFEIERIEGINKTKSIRPIFLKAMTFNALNDCHWKQYFCLARKKD